MKILCAFIQPALAAIGASFLLFCMSSAVTSQMAASVNSLSPAAIVEAYDQALGGRDAIRRHISSTMRGTLEQHRDSGTVTLPFISYAAAPYQSFQKVTLPNNAGDNLSGFDNDIAWQFDPRTGPQLIEGDQMQSVKRDADFYYAIDELSWFKSMENVGIEEFEGHDCTHLHGITKWGRPNNQFYDRETGLLVGYEFDSAWRGGSGLTHEIFSDYRKIDGVLVSMKQTFKGKPKSGGEWTVTQVLTISSVTFNDVDPAVFDLPPPVRDLIAKKRKPSS